MNASSTTPARSAIHGAAATARSTMSSVGVAGGSLPAPLALTVVIVRPPEPSRSPRASRSAAASPAQALELAAQALARSALSTYEGDPRRDLWHDGRAVVHVAGRRNGGPDARLDWQHDLDDALALGDERLHPIARPNLRRRLRRRSIHDDMAGLAQPCRERTGLHEAH